VIVAAVASGTSADGLDVAVVQLGWGDDARADGDGVDDGGVVTLRSLRTWTRPWPDGLRERVLALLPPSGTTARELALVDAAVGQAVAEAAAEAVATVSGIELVVSPGQTVHHEVMGDRCLATLQLGQPAWVAEATGLPVLSDLRSTDVAAGGHGAPLASTFDALWLGDREAALNLGGIANVTVQAGRTVVAFDTGPASCLLDLVAARATDGRLGYDADGRLAAAGTVDGELLERMLADPYFALPVPRSTGREHFGAEWLDRHLAGRTDWPQVAATLTELSARTVAGSLHPYGPRRVLVSGGGVHNPELLRRLRAGLPGVDVVVSTEAGVDPDAKEVLMWALLGFLGWHGVPATRAAGERTLTGAAGPRVLGRFTPGRDGLRLPKPRARAVERLRVLPDGVAGR
jgi:anhydro-N-acetylmuramic acid kinase